MLKTLPFKPFLQDEYGKDMDCTLTSISACIANRTGKISDSDFAVIYANIETCAGYYFYNGDTY